MLACMVLTTSRMPFWMRSMTTRISSIRTAGPLSREGDAFAGGLWLVEAETADTVDRLVKEDPFWAAGLRKSVQVFIWNRVFAERALL